MLSILIPTYNYNCYQLVAELRRQALEAGIVFEVIVADDGSMECHKTANRAINDLSHCRYVERTENVGRARIRNYLAQCARYDYLLFMDSDAVVVKDDFVRCYVSACTPGVVLYGGIVLPKALPSADYSLAYRYERRALRGQTLAERSRHPYRVFRTFNFLAPREVVMQHPFDEHIRGYGHEDTLFGLGLCQAGITVRHIDNALQNGGLDKNDEVLRKTEESLHTLYALRAELAAVSPLLRMYRWVERLHLCAMLNAIFAMCRQPMRGNLLGAHPFLWCFALYKLGYYAHIVRAHQ